MRCTKHCAMNLCICFLQSEDVAHFAPRAGAGINQPEVVWCQFETTGEHVAIPQNQMQRRALLSRFSVVMLPFVYSIAGYYLLFPISAAKSGGFAAASISDGMEWNLSN